jgi:probable phosphoglycerate mutase
MCQGQLDIPLNTTGLEQAGTARAILAKLPIATICCSPLSRARRTAEIINEALNCPLAIIDGLMECSFGNLEGQAFTGNTYREIHDEALSLGAEPLDAFVERVAGAIEEALSHPGPVLIVSHGGAFWAIGQRFSLGTDEIIANATPVRFDPSGEEANRWSVAPIQ